jgi:hypothetical protein
MNRDFGIHCVLMFLLHFLQMLSVSQSFGIKFCCNLLYYIMKCHNLISYYDLQFLFAIVSLSFNISININ